MKYECSIIIYKENKHMNVAYIVKNNYDFFNEIRDTKRSLFWLLTRRLGILKNHIQNNSYHYVVYQKCVQEFFSAQKGFLLLNLYQIYY